MKSSPIHQKFSDALADLVEQIKADRSVLAAVLCGSLSHDTVWEKSDIDLILVTVDDNKVGPSDLALYADGVNVHANLMPRAEFRKAIEGSLHNSFIHALLAKGRLLYTHDQTIADLCAQLADIGGRDTQLQLLRAATHALPSLYKAHKWSVTRGDLDYTALWILYTATPIAQIEVIGARLIADREVIPQAMKLNPSLFATIYTDLLNARKTPQKVQAALDAIDRYLADRAPELFGLVIAYLQEAGEARSCSEIENYFCRQYQLGGVTTACEYLADQGLIGKASLPVRLTKRSNVDVQEMAFFYSGSLDGKRR
jgi:predicted nucleotidyltransferase